MWGNMNALYGAASKAGVRAVQPLYLPPSPSLSLAVLFIGAIVGATVETIQFDNDAPHSFGTASRWIVMYPNPTT